MNSNDNIKALSYGGITVALILVLMYLGSLMRFNKLSIMFLASVLIALLIFRYGVKYGIIAYVSCSVFGVLLVPDKSIALLFIVFSGLYPIVKLFIERIRNIGLETVLKLIYISLSFSGFYYLIRLNIVDIESLKRSFIDKNPLSDLGGIMIFFAIIILVALFFIYDILLSRVTYIAADKMKKLD